MTWPWVARFGSYAHAGLEIRPSLRASGGRLAPCLRGKSGYRIADMETSNPLLKREGAFSAPWTRSEPMTLQGVINKTGILLLLCMGTGVYAWTHPAFRGPMVLVGLIGGLIACLVGTFKPSTSPIA